MRAASSRGVMSLVVKLGQVSTGPDSIGEHHLGGQQVEKTHFESELLLGQILKNFLHFSAVFHNIFKFGKHLLIQLKKVSQSKNNNISFNLVLTLKSRISLIFTQVDHKDTPSIIINCFA